MAGKGLESSPASKSPKNLNGQKRFTFEEVAKHDHEKDCWVVIDGKVYDVTKFVPRHPGGNMIFVNAGKDSTYLFDSYHPDRARQVLQKFYIGDVEPTNDGIRAYRIGFGQVEEDAKFYSTVKERVQSLFKAKKIDPRFSTAMYIKSLIIVMSLVMSLYGALLHPFQCTLCSVLCAVLLGFSSAMVGVNIQHDANHGAYSSNPNINKWIGTFLDLVGASSFMWKQQHVVGHHVYTNVEGYDPDIRVKDPDVRRVTKEQPWQPYQAYQHLYLGFLYGLLSIKSILMDDFTALSSGFIGAIPLPRLNAEEKTVFWSGKFIWLIYYVAIPVMFTPHGWAELALLWTVAQLCAGWTLAFMFQVNHVTDDVDFYVGTGKEKVARGWAMTQVEGTSDFAHGSWFWTHISGGLNYQVVHHLFPGVCHTHYPLIAPVIKEACKEFGLNYVVYPSFWDAVSAHFKLMKKMGQGVEKMVKLH